MGPGILQIFIAAWMTTSAGIGGDVGGAYLAILGRLTSYPATFQIGERAVSNWRFESARHVDGAVRFLFGPATNIPRCIKLNNYWCIKHAGWDGEIAADEEGHVAFASAPEGALVAVRLLRRYYLEFGRRSALAIVSHWAPSRCPAPPAVRTAGKRVLVQAMQAPEIALPRTEESAFRRHVAAAKLRHDAWLADILRRHALSPPAPASAPLPRVVFSVAASEPAAAVGFCASEQDRIATYARYAMRGIAEKPTDDLQLFEAGGRAFPNLGRLMANMAAIGIGPFHADPNLIAVAIAQAEGTWRPAAADR